MKQKPQLSVIGVCAGSGGALLFPFLNDPKFKVIGNIEPRPVFHTPKEEQWRLNFGEIPFVKSFELLDCSPDILVSSPDCGASSIMRLSKKKELGKPRENKTINLVFHAILTYKPEIFLIENLPKLLEFIPREEIEAKFADYKLVFHCHSVIEFGNSQKSRKRLVIIGIKRSCKNYLNSFDKIFRVNTPKNSGRLLKSIGEKGNYIPKPSKVLAMYDYRELPEKKNLTVKQIYDLWNHDFKDEYKWPIKTKKMKTLPGVYRLREDRYPMTLRPADRQFRPDGWPLGIQDYRRIMGFPKDFKIYMDERRLQYYLNKARYTLAKGSVYQVGEWFKQCIG